MCYLAEVHSTGSCSNQPRVQTKNACPLPFKFLFGPIAKILFSLKIVETEKF